MIAWSFKTPSPLKDWIKYFLPLLRPYIGELSLATLAMAVSALFSVLRPWPLKVVIDRVLAHKAKHSHVPLLDSWLDHASFSPLQVLYGACVAAVLIASVVGLFTYFYTRILGNIGQRYVFALRQKLFAHLQRLSLRFHDSQRTGDLTTRLTSDIQAIRDLITDTIMVFGNNALQLLSMLVLMFWLDWRLTFAALSVIPLLLLTVFRYTYRIKLAARRARKATGLMAALAQEALASIRIVQGLAQEQQIDERFRVKSEDNLEAYLESLRYQARVGPLMDIIAALGSAIVIWYGGTHALRGQLTTGDLVVFFSYVTSFFRPIRGLARYSYLSSRASVGAERIAEVLSVQNELADREGARPAPKLEGALTFRDVSFAYEPGRPVLCDINLSITPGEKVAIVGATGAGKSTLVSLIPRFYDSTAGAVLVDGNDIRDFTISSLREQISLVLQDSLLFSGTIRENIAFGRPDARDEEIVTAAQLANAEEFIQDLPDAYESPVSERATTLSGGQKQRIAIARAILRDAPILILDEPTSSLDAAAEHTVMEALDRAAAGRTTIIIAHRFSTVRLADRIIVLERGQIVEEGTHEQLLWQEGRYAQFFNLQRFAESEARPVIAHQPAPSD
jgi:ATP-binding cassette, subfamily B, bacterial